MNSTLECIQKEYATFPPARRCSFQNAQNCQIGSLFLAGSRAANKPTTIYIVVCTENGHIIQPSIRTVEFMRMYK